MAGQLDTHGEHSTRGSGSPREPGTAPLLEAGQVIAGQFEVVRPLGRGGMGVVYEVRDRVTGERLGLKTILPIHLANPKAVRRFIEEINAARSLRHPNIVSVFDVGQDKGNPSASLFFTMEFLEGQSVRKLMDKRGRFDLAEVGVLLTQLCDALEYAHEFIVHRDLSPENVMVLEDGTVKLLDFGLARTLKRATMTATGAALGKAHYISPEQRKSSAHVDKRTDIYALGVMLYEMLAAQLPGGYQRLRDLRPDLPPEVDRLVGRCLCRVEQRIESAGAFRAALRQGLEAHRARHTPAPASMTPRVPTLPAESGSPPSTTVGQPPVKPYQPGLVFNATDIMESISAPSHAEPVRVKKTGPLGMLRDAVETVSDMLGGWLKPIIVGTLVIAAVVVVGSIAIQLLPAHVTGVGLSDAEGQRDEASQPPETRDTQATEKPVPLTPPPLPAAQATPPPAPPPQPTLPRFTDRLWRLHDTTANKPLNQIVVFYPNGTLSFTYSDGKTYSGAWSVTARQTLSFKTRYIRSSKGTMTNASYEAVKYDGNTMTGKCMTQDPFGRYAFQWGATAD